MATPPTRVSFNAPATGNFSSGATPKVTPAFDVVSGDLIVVICTAESNLNVSTVTPSASGGTVTWTAQVTNNTAATSPNSSPGYVWTGAVGAAATGITVTLAKRSTDPSLFYGFSATLWRSHGGVGTTFNGNNGTGSGAPSVAGAASCAANSAVQVGVN